MPAPTPDKVEEWNRRFHIAAHWVSFDSYPLVRLDGTYSHANLCLLLRGLEELFLVDENAPRISDSDRNINHLQQHLLARHAPGHLYYHALSVSAAAGATAQYAINSGCGGLDKKALLESMARLLVAFTQLASHLDVPMSRIFEIAKSDCKDIEPARLP